MKTHLHMTFAVFFFVFVLFLNLRLQLFAAQDIRIAAFRRLTQSTAIGPSHAFVQYTFNHDPLLIEALLALCVNRWIDLHGV